MRKLKKALSLSLALALSLVMAIPAFATAQTTVYVQYVDIKDGSDLNVSGSRTAPAGEEKNSALRLESDGLTETGTFYESWGDTLTGPYPVYTSASPVKITLTEGYTREEVLQEIAKGENGYYEGGVNTLSVDKVVYNEADKSITVLQKNAAFFEGMIYFYGKDPCTIKAYYSQDEKTHEEYFWALPSIEVGSSVTLSQPGTYFISESRSNTYGATQALITISESQPGKPDDTKPTQPQKPGSAVAAPTNDKLTMDGKLQNPTVLKLDGGDNYFKIRDLAAMLNGTGKQFSVGYDGSVQVTTGRPYTPVGGELTGPATATEIAEPSNDVIYINGEKANLTAFKVGGNNFFRLRDLGKALDFYVGWTAERGVFIETGKPYGD